MMHVPASLQPLKRLRVIEEAMGMVEDAPLGDGPSTGDGEVPHEAVEVFMDEVLRENPIMPGPPASVEAKDELICNLSVNVKLILHLLGNKRFFILSFLHI